MSELNTQNTLITLVVVVKDLKVLHGSGHEEVKQKPVIKLEVIICHCNVG